MRVTHLPLISLACLGLAACGSDPAEGPAEQIVVKEPGEADAAAAPAAAEPADDVATAGLAAFEANCAVCHGVEAGEASGIGPNLHGVVGRPAASLDDFAYSEAMAASGITWSADAIEDYIANPTERLPGTSMAGVLVSDAGDRAPIVGYLATLGSD